MPLCPVQKGVYWPLARREGEEGEFSGEGEVKGGVGVKGGVKGCGGFTYKGKGGTDDWD